MNFSLYETLRKTKAKAAWGYWMDGMSDSVFAQRHVRVRQQMYVAVHAPVSSVYTFGCCAETNWIFCVNWAYVLIENRTTNQSYLDSMGFYLFYLLFRLSNSISLSALIFNIGNTCHRLCSRQNYSEISKPSVALSRTLL